MIPDAVPYGGKIAQLLRLRTHVSSGEAHLTLLVLKSTGEVLGTYTGTNRALKKSLPQLKVILLQVRSSRALSEAVHQIQDKLSHDTELRKVASY